jgi:hypothetical protein
VTGVHTSWLIRVSFKNIGVPRVEWKRVDVRLLQKGNKDMEKVELKTGSLIIVDGKTLVVTSIRTEETISGRAVQISASDQETARTTQVHNIQSNETTQQLMDMIQKMAQGKFPGGMSGE